MSNNFKLAVVGKESSVLIFRTLGTEVFGVFSEEESHSVVEKLAFSTHDDEAQTPEYAVIFVEEDYYKVLPPDFLEKMTKRSLPAIVPVPSPSAKDEDFAVKRLSKIVERAVGSDIMG